jgi:hypothetical protein
LEFNVPIGSQKALTKQFYTFEGQVISITPWSPYFDAKDGTNGYTARHPLWVQIVGIPHFYYTSKFLTKAMETFAEVIYVEGIVC